MDNYGSDVLRNVLEHSSDLFCITQDEFKIVDANESFRTYFDIESIDNQHFFELIYPDYNNETHFSTQLLNRSEQQYFFINWQKVEVENQPSIFWIGKIDLNHKIKSLEETGRMGKIGFWEYDINKKEVHWSEEVYKIHEESLDKNIALEAGINYYHPDDVSIISELFLDALNKGIPFEVELRIITAKNNVKWVKSIGEQVSENGKAIKIKGTFQDIHRRKTAELTLKRSKVLSQQIIDSLPVGVFWKNKEGVYEGFNKTSTEFIGMSPEELIGKKDKDLIKDAEVLKKVLNQDKEVLFNEKTLSENRNVKLNLKNTVRSVEIKKTPLYNENNEVSGILGVYIDNTRLVKLIRSLKSKNNELGELLFAASHDLKEPLQGINRYSQLLKRRYNITLEKHGNQMLDYILREAKRQYQQFNGLTRFLEVGDKEQEITNINISTPINNAINNINFAEFNFPEFEVVFNELPNINYNEHDLEVIFYELINNAIKFRKINEQLVIEIEVIERAEDWKIAVKDNGEGFDISLKHKIFMIFQKLHNKYYYDGPGIGLSICKRIIEHYGGEINVTSGVNKGTTFIFTIPKVIIQRSSLSEIDFF